MPQADTGWARVPAILSFPDTAAFSETYGFGAASGTVWLEGQYLILDPVIDPNGRPPGRCYLGDPKVVNTSPAGLARYSSLRSWLSQWSWDLSNAKGPKNAARIRRAPVLQVENQADDAVPASHNPTIHAALATPDKEYVRIEGATHYYQNQPRQLRQCIDAVVDWSRRKRLLAD